MWPVAIFLMIVVTFYWAAFWLSVWAWFNAICHLFRGNFIRCALWFNVGTWMLFWWFDEPTRTLDWDHFLPGACVFVGVGALGVPPMAQAAAGDADHADVADVADVANAIGERRPVHQAQGRAQAGLI